MPSPTPVLVDQFARSFNAAYATEHTVTSPLGWWLLLALAAPAAQGADRAELARVLGTDVDDAAARAALLLADPHPAVSCAAAVWARAGLTTQEFRSWATHLPERVATGTVPDQAGADAWVREATRDLIAAFPGRLDSDVAGVVATALATKVTWEAAFDTAAPADLGGQFASGASGALATPRAGHEVFLADTTAAGLVAVHRARSVDGLDVVSVIAHPDVPAPQVHTAAGQVAGMLAGWSGEATRRSVFDVPVGSGHAWTLTERTRMRDGGARGHDATAVLPVWSASGRHDLSAAAGAGPLTGVLDSFLVPAYRPAQTSIEQVAVASYTATGFDAAALTYAVFAGCAMPQLAPAPWRELRVAFNRPYAVVAVARTEVLRVREHAGGAGSLVTGSVWQESVGAQWAGVPVFSAWVGEPG